jgi:hypothetical protein
MSRMLLFWFFERMYRNLFLGCTFIFIDWRDGKFQRKIDDVYGIWITHRRTRYEEFAWRRKYRVLYKGWAVAQLF